jgi:hypothetical protein
MVKARAILGLITGYFAVWAYKTLYLPYTVTYAHFKDKEKEYLDREVNS